jgi:hypothetical protein
VFDRAQKNNTKKQSHSNKGPTAKPTKKEKTQK